MKVRHFASAMLLAVGVLFNCAPELRANQVTDLNEAALRTMTSAHMGVLEIERALAIVQIAVYEAANAAQPIYERSAIAVAPAPGASVAAAIAEAGYRSLVALMPAGANHAALDAEHDRNLAGIADSAQKKAGIATGAAAAAAVLQWRSDDGADFSTTYVPGTGPGAYQPTSDSPLNGPVAARMRPFVLSSYSSLRPPPPPPLDGSQMRRDFEEIAAWGGKDSKLRTADQTEFARFHAQPGVFSWNNIGRQTAEHQQLDEVKTAHLLAALDTAIVESHFACWEAKYFYNLWRPVTAIRAGGGPLQEKPSPDWTPLLTTPMIPEYPCAHCALGSAAQVVLESLAGTGPVELTVASDGVTRHFQSFRQFAEEESASRMYGGVHYRWSNAVGDTLGREAGTLVLAKAAQPLQAGTR